MLVTESKIQWRTERGHRNLSEKAKKRLNVSNLVSQVVFTIGMSEMCSNPGNFPNCPTPTGKGAETDVSVKCLRMWMIYSKLISQGKLPQMHLCHCIFHMATHFKEEIIASYRFRYLPNVHMVNLKLELCSQPTPCTVGCYPWQEESSQEDE